MLRQIYFSFWALPYIPKWVDPPKQDQERSNYLYCNAFHLWGTRKAGPHSYPQTVVHLQYQHVPVALLSHMKRTKIIEVAYAYLRDTFLKNLKQQRVFDRVSIRFFVLQITFRSTILKN